MVDRNPSSIGRTLVCAIALTAFANCALAVAAYGQTPPAAHEDDAPPPKAPAEDAGAPASSPSPSARSVTASRADCERYAKALAGRDKDSAVLKQTEVKALAARSVDLVTCSAVLADSGEPCERLERGDADTCRKDFAVFHELRAYPNGKSFMFDERKFEECKQNAAMAPVCDALRTALRSGDPSQCVLKADFEAICRSAGDIDVSKCATEAPQLKQILEAHCRAMATLDESECDVPGPRQAEMAKQCRDDIKANKAYGKGLKQLATSGSPREKELAKAALNESNACAAFTQSAVDACLSPDAAPTKGPPSSAPEAADAAPPPAGAKPPTQ